jgi:hypothetical protein
MKELSEWPHRKPLDIPSALTKYPQISELHSDPSLDDFINFYRSACNVVVIRKLALSWPACQKWKDRYYLQQAFKRLSFPVELGHDYLDSEWHQENMSFYIFYQDYIISEDRHFRPKGYLAQIKLTEHFPYLLKDIKIPIYCRTSVKNNSLDIFAWLGPEGTESPLHTDKKDNIFIQLVGKKLVVTFDEKDTPYLYPHSEEKISNSSKINLINPDIINFPKFSLASYGAITILEPGDALFIPKGTWHFVKSLQPSWSLSFWFN